jgi:hypothetical protein
VRLLSTWSDEARDARAAGEVVQVRRLGRVEPQDPGEGVEHLGRDGPALILLEAGVVAGADPGELGELLAPQTRNAPGAAVGPQADVVGGDAIAPRLEERTEALALHDLDRR